MFRRLPWVLLFLLMLCGVGQAQTQDLTPLQRRADDVVALINEPKEFEKFFSPDFLVAVPPLKVTQLFQSLTTQYGHATGHQKIAPQSQYAGQIIIAFEKNVVTRINLNLEKKAPFLINGLFILPSESSAASFEALVEQLRALPGQTALSVVKLDGNSLKPLVAYNADQSLAVASTFKLYVLSELVRGIGAGERRWSDVVELSEASFPSGQMHNWQIGSPVTLHTLAAMMISISDNTATDQLITVLGREQIEAMMSTAGNSNPARSFPFLKTIELFKIKGHPKPGFAATYAAKTVAERRQWLETEVATFPRKDVIFGSRAKPGNIAQLEWFASPNDLARALNWLRLHTDAPDDKARGILSINKALPINEAARWNYVGYKGGSEVGVMSMTYLVQSKKGEWFVVSGTWNNEAAPVDESNFTSIMNKAVQLLRGKN